MTPIPKSAMPVVEYISPEKSKNEIWYGTYRDIRYEIMLHAQGRMGPRLQGIWCYYLLLSELQFTKEDWQEIWLSPKGSVRRSAGYKMPGYDEDNAAIGKIYWHGGVTFYEKQGGLDGNLKRVKVGCDFAHYFDDQCGPYSLDAVTAELKRTIDELCERFRVKKPCSYTGRYVFERYGVWENGQFYSRAGLRKEKESKEARDARDALTTFLGKEEDAQR